MILFRQPIFTSKTYNHTLTYNHASADGNLPYFHEKCFAIVSGKFNLYRRAIYETKNTGTWK